MRLICIMVALQGGPSAAVQMGAANFTEAATLSLSSKTKPPPPAGATALAGAPHIRHTGQACNIQKPLPHWWRLLIIWRGMASGVEDRLCEQSTIEISVPCSENESTFAVFPAKLCGIDSRHSATSEHLWQAGVSIVRTVFCMSLPCNDRCICLILLCQSCQSCCTTWKLQRNIAYCAFKTMH